MRKPTQTKGEEMIRDGKTTEYTAAWISLSLKEAKTYWVIRQSGSFWKEVGRFGKNFAHAESSKVESQKSEI